MIWNSLDISSGWGMHKKWFNVLFDSTDNDVYLFAQFCGKKISNVRKTFWMNQLKVLKQKQTAAYILKTGVVKKGKNKIHSVISLCLLEVQHSLYIRENIRKKDEENNSNAFRSAGYTGSVSVECLTFTILLYSPHNFHQHQPQFSSLWWLVKESISLVSVSGVSSLVSITL